MEFKIKYSVHIKNMMIEWCVSKTVTTKVINKGRKISHSGNSLIVRIPKAIAKFVDIEEGEEVVIRPEGKKKFIVDASG